MFDGLSLPITVTEVISAGGELVAYVGGFVAVGLAFMFAPKLISLIRTAFATRGKN